MKYKFALISFLALVLCGCHKVEDDKKPVVDGEVVWLQKATEGKGIDLVIMGDGFTADMIRSGTYEERMRTVAESYFSERPLSDYRHLFNVCYIVAVSEQAGIGDGVNTCFGMKKEKSGSYIGSHSMVELYVENALGHERLQRSQNIVLGNYKEVGGTTYMASVPDNDWGDGRSIAYIPMCNSDRMLRCVVLHESAGHGLGKLGDEYFYNGRGVIGESEKEKIRTYQQRGFYRNIDLTLDPLQVKWSRFIQDPRYADEGLGVFKGAFCYEAGVYRPTNDSLMGEVRELFSSFNAPSREALYITMHKFAFGDDWEYDYETFVEQDLK